MFNHFQKIYVHNFLAKQKNEETLSMKVQSSPIMYVGGKSRLVEILKPMIPQHTCYVEAFAGGANLLFSRLPSKVEVLNDFDSNLINFYKVVRDDYVALIQSLEFTLTSRELFEEYKAKYKKNDYKDSLEQAHIYYYLNRACFAADMRNPVFGTHTDRPNGLVVKDIDKNIRLAHSRLSKVTIENKSFEFLFDIYDTENTFFFLDSPYRETKQYAVGNFGDDKFQLLKECCEKCKGKFLYTINDDEYIRELFKDFYIQDHNVQYSVSQFDEGRREFKELIITNYEIKKKNQLGKFVK